MIGLSAARSLDANASQLYNVMLTECGLDLPNGAKWLLSRKRTNLSRLRISASKFAIAVHKEMHKNAPI
jgi:hypothetical protein